MPTIRPSLQKLIPNFQGFPKELALPSDVIGRLSSMNEKDPADYRWGVKEVAERFNAGLRRQMKSPTSEAIYNPTVLDAYDVIVWDFNSPFHWRIERDEIQRVYNECVHDSKRHCEIAVGTGLFLRNLDPKATLQLREVDLLDLNQEALDNCSKRLKICEHFASVDIKNYNCNIMESVPEELEGKFDSVAANFLLHCLHGSSMFDKRPAIVNFAKLLSPRGVMFGSTILGEEMVRDGLERGDPAFDTLLDYNEWGIFGNLGDTYDACSAVLHDAFDDVDIWRSGYCAVWKARIPKKL